MAVEHFLVGAPTIHATTRCLAEDMDLFDMILLTVRQLVILMIVDLFVAMNIHCNFIVVIHPAIEI